MRLSFVIGLLASLFFFGCSNQNSTAPTVRQLDHKIIDTRLTENIGTTDPVLIGSNDSNFFVYKYKTRIYVVGSRKMSQKFSKQHHLPYTRTILGAGPTGETVIFEVQKKNSAYVNRLQEKFESTPKLLSSQPSFHVWKFKGRIYVIGKDKTHKAFRTNLFLPYTKTILGAGPSGETVIFEVDKKNGNFADGLKQKYQQMVSKG